MNRLPTNQYQQAGSFHLAQSAVFNSFWLISDNDDSFELFGNNSRLYTHHLEICAMNEEKSQREGERDRNLMR
jgi:hypothetical protein